MKKSLKFWLPAFAVFIVACGPSLARQRHYRTNVNGLPVDIGQLGGLSCSSIGIGTRPTQADLDLCKKFLPEKDGAALQILWKFFDNVVSDGVHNLDTCPILALYPIQQGHRDGTITDAQFAERIYSFYKAKFRQDLNGKAKDCKKALIAAGLPVP